MLRRVGYLFYLSLFLLVLGFPVFSVKAQGQNSSPVAVVMTATGPLTPIMVEYIQRGLQNAQTLHAEVVILQLDTPGGGIDLMETIVQDIRASSIPVVVYVSPHNAMAGSAGTIITLAGDVVAMAPETTIGAASPVGANGQDIGQTEDTKVKEMLKADVRTLTSGRNPEATQMAEQAIDQATAYTVDEAMKAGMADIKATDLNDLLKQLNGRTVKLANNTQVVLDTNNISIVIVSNSLIENLLQALTDPNLVFVLLAVGIQAILIELSNPTGWIAGFVGAVCLLLAIYGLGLLPVNWFGGLFIVLAFVLFVLDIKAPTHGALTVVGAISFIVGSLVLFNSTALPGFPTVSVPLVIGTGVLIAAFFFAIVSFALRAQRLPVRMGKQTLLGQIATVRTDLNPLGQINIGGENWSAELVEDETPPVRTGERVEVIDVEGLHIKVRKAK
ncbi:MAG TPA: nodulation protein NfeD [Anaerolineaceae bacterium]|nr:nodulation protein NfeD [Anaerolineaceae bacterium]